MTSATADLSAGSTPATGTALAGVSTVARPETDGAGTEPYQTWSRHEILLLLHDIIDRRVPVTLHFDQGEQQMPTALLHLNPGFEELIFDSAVPDAANARIIESKRLTFVAFVDHIKIQFRAGHAEAARFEGRPALRVRIPDAVLRLQRRDAFRVDLPKADALYCDIGGNTQPRAGITRLMISDLSVGGINLITDATPGGWKPGALLGQCRIALPGESAFTAALEIRHTVAAGRDARGKLRIQYGCAFVQLPGTAVNLIQRYINQIERMRRALA